MKIKRMLKCLMLCAAILPVHDVVADLLPFDLKRVYVEFCSNDDTGRSTTKWVRRNSKMTLPANKFKRSGYVCTGWQNDDTGEIYAAGEKIAVGDWEYLRLLAVWEPLWSSKATECSIALYNSWQDVEGLATVKASKPNSSTGISSVSVTVNLLQDLGNGPKKISFKGKTNNGYISMRNGTYSLVLWMDGSGGAYAEFESDDYLSLYGETDGRATSLPPGTYYVTAPIGYCTVCTDKPLVEFPDSVPMQVNGNRWTVTTSRSENPTKLKLTYKAKTGQFSGSFRGSLCGKKSFKILGAVNNGEALGFVANGDCSGGFSITHTR